MINLKIIIKLKNLTLKHFETMMLMKNQIKVKLKKKLKNINNFNLITQKLTKIKYNKQIHQSIKSSHYIFMKYVRNNDNLIMRD